MTGEEVTPEALRTAAEQAKHLCHELQFMRVAAQSQSPSSGMYKDVDAAVSLEQAPGAGDRGEQQQQSISSVQKRIRSLQLIDSGISTAIERKQQHQRQRPGADANGARGPPRGSSIPSRTIQRNVKEGLAALDELLQELFRASDQLHEEVLASAGPGSRRRRSGRTRRPAARRRARPVGASRRRGRRWGPAGAGGAPARTSRVRAG